jgi:hypothetical protein
MNRTGRPIPLLAQPRRAVNRGIARLPHLRFESACFRSVLGLLLGTNRPVTTAQRGLDRLHQRHVAV